MREILLSPGVLAKETDNSFVSQLPESIGAAIIGPTVKGKVGIPKKVTTYSEYVENFGESFLSGSEVCTYLTSISAYNYFSNGGTSLLVTRVQSGSWSPASSSINNSSSTTLGAPAINLLSYDNNFGNTINRFIKVDSPVNGKSFTFIANSGSDDIINGVYYVPVTSSINSFLNSIAVKINTLPSLNTNYSASVTSNTLLMVLEETGSIYNNTLLSYGVNNTTEFNEYFIHGTDFSYTGQCFEVEFLNDGIIGNNDGQETTNGTLLHGTKDNIRCEIANVDSSTGTFTLYVRRGDDNNKNKIILESFAGLSLDPMNSNYIEKVIGNQKQTYDSVNKYIKIEGSYPNASKLIRIKQVFTPTPNYLDTNGVINPTYLNKLPVIQNTKFSGATGNYFTTGILNLFDKISTQTQGLVADNYRDAINLLTNKDDYRFNVITTPGLIHNVSGHADVIDDLISVVEDRGDAIYVVDLVSYGSTKTQCITEAKTIDSSYATSYYPWLQMSDNNTGKLVFVPASVCIAGVYAFTDKVSEPWYAPAGINRGGLSNVLEVERKLSQNDRDDLYVGKVNPITKFPNTGIVVYGQKTLQSKPSSLDRVNVRRLMIELKNYLGDVAKNLVFEQNTIATRNTFLRQANPYLENVQQKNGLYAFKVIMDDTINTNDVIDRNQLVGKIFLQPTKTAEYIILDFTLTPTGASFE